jgi:hypothetical protein
MSKRVTHRVKAPRYLRRMLLNRYPCNYRREEYATAADRNARFAQLRGLRGLVKYSDTGAAGLVYVVAWTGEEQGELPGRGTPANRTTTPPVDSLAHGKLPNLGFGVVSIETGGTV